MLRYSTAWSDSVQGLELTVVAAVLLSGVSIFGGSGGVVGVVAGVLLIRTETASASSQVSHINTLTQKRTNVIAIAANDPNAVCSG